MIIACKPLCCATEGQLEYYVCLHYVSESADTTSIDNMLKELLSLLPDFVYKSEDGVEGHLAPTKYDGIQMDAEDVRNGNDHDHGSGGNGSGSSNSGTDAVDANYAHSYITNPTGADVTAKPQSRSFFNRVLGRQRRNSKVGVDGAPLAYSDPDYDHNHTTGLVSDQDVAAAGRSLPSSLSNSVSRMFNMLSRSSNSNS